jgi:hypothetical protein
MLTMSYTTMSALLRERESEVERALRSNAQRTRRRRRRASRTPLMTTPGGGYGMRTILPRV